MQRMAMPPPFESVQKALEWSKGKPGSSVRILTMSNDTQRAVVLYRAQSQGRECPHYYDVELKRASPMSQYANLGKGSILSSAPYRESEYQESRRAFERYKVLAEGGTVIK
jgi:hypothetical protein